MAKKQGNLNKEQSEAVSFGEGPLLIVAGAGTGKTTVITERIVSLIERGLAKPEEILAVTFTEKAAAEMEDRVDRLLPFGYRELWISTFHAFCEKVLRDNGLDIGLPVNFKLVDQTAAWLLLRQNLDKFDLDYYRPLGNPMKFIHALLGHFSRCKDQMICPEDYLKYADELKSNLTDLPEGSEAERIKEVAGAYHTYQKLLLDNNLLDFGDLINYCLRLFQKRPAILEKYRARFKYILVDEFQDTNWAQYELIKTLAAPKNNLTVCSDDDQAVYKWRGASVSNITQFKKDFPDACEVFLVKNYRSSQNILDLAYNFIQANNPNRLEFISGINKKLKSQNEAEGVVEHLHFKNLGQEAAGVVQKIAEIMSKDKEASFSDFVILVRANDTANPFVRALERAGVPYQFLASQGLYFKPIILDMIAYLKLLDNYHESSAVFRVLSWPVWGITPEELMKLTHFSHQKAQSLFETTSGFALIKGISPKTANSLNKFLAQVKKHTEMAREKNITEIFLAFLEDSGYLKHITKGEAAKQDWNKREDLEFLAQFYQKLKEFEQASPDGSLKNFMNQFNLELESDEQGKLAFDPDQGPDLVRVMTIHAAKGLEFKYVFAAGMVDRRFPSTERKDPIEIPEALVKEKLPEGDVHLQEERRLCYVAMTRAKKGLFFTSADDYGGARKKKISQFLAEMGFTASDESKVKPLADLEQPGKIVKKSFSKIVLPEHFSFTQLAAFDTCPYQYKLAHILKVPAKGRPSFSFGKSIHNTLHEFLTRVQEASSKEQTNLFGASSDAPARPGTAVSEDELMKIYDKHWLDEWFDGKKQKQDYYQAGKRMLKDFYERVAQNPPRLLKFRDKPALEVEFNLKLGEYSLKGKIDRIDEAEGGVRLLDYKTGKPEEKISKADKTQLLLYQIAAEEALGLNPVELCYYYLEGGGLVSFLGSEKEKDDLKAKIISDIEEIKRSDFAPSPGWHCQFCDFKGICEFANKNNG
ncbi:MAG: UvrD-helicase domain-containing protein [Candidatus Pacebacteria bacterium]|nr:UvrD-helicase domain-containing protein [Candidatus Paceibacterota bacterium]